MSTSTEMPKGITRGYSTAFRQMLTEAAVRALSIKDLEALDSADVEREIARAELARRVELEDGTP